MRLVTETSDSVYLSRAASGTFPPFSGSTSSRKISCGRLLRCRFLFRISKVLPDRAVRRTSAAGSEHHILLNSSETGRTFCIVQSSAVLSYKPCTLAGLQYRCTLPNFSDNEQRPTSKKNG